MAATMTRADEIAVERERAMCRIDEAARDAGHDPHPWHVEDVAAAHTACRRCGHGAAVRVRQAGTWQAGQLRFSQCPNPRPKEA